ncbi:c-type heme family protein [Roseomonas sp. F4]
MLYIMGIRAKLNLGLLAVFALAAAAAWVFLSQQFEAGARREVLQNARIMLSAANAVRTYTIAEVVPAVMRERADWVAPLTVPSYAAQYNFRAVRAEHPDYTYKEAALNPTNPADRALDWEADFINSFRNNTSLTELLGERQVRGERVLTLARPITIRDPACLTCHSTVEAAPARMVAAYGPTNGFGWRMNETVGAQLVSVPMQAALRSAQANLLSAMAVLLGIFIGLMVALNLLLHFVILRPMDRIVRIATAVSLGKPVEENFTVTGRDQMGELGRAFQRMRRSLEEAVRMLGA